MATVTGMEITFRQPVRAAPAETQNLVCLAAAHTSNKGAIFMAKINFSGTEEEVVTRQEFPLEKAQQLLKDETVAVLGYGVQGPAQALNMRDNGIKVIVGVNRGGRGWKKAVKDGWVPGETLFSLEEAATRGTVIQLSLIHI